MQLPIARVLRLKTAELTCLHSLLFKHHRYSNNLMQLHLQNEVQSSNWHQMPKVCPDSSTLHKQGSIKTIDAAHVLARKPENFLKTPKPLLVNHAIQCEVE
jgi:hypothetical protein